MATRISPHARVYSRETRDMQKGDFVTKSFPIIAIGASAGGLAAFEAFFSGMPIEGRPDLAIVLVQHLAPDYKSILTDLIRRFTRMDVFEVDDGMTVEPNCVYIIPPNRDMAYINGTLQLFAQTHPRGQRMPIDFLFRSLAEDLHERAICVVLSGTGSDGTIGVRQIKGEGGLVVVQNPKSTEHDGMPRSAIATGLVDYILPPAEMAPQIISYVSHAFTVPSLGVLPESLLTGKDEDVMKKIFVLLRAHTSHDFSQYKQNTIRRRIQRRLAVHQIDNADNYLLFLQNTPSEVDALFRDLLIGVTSFFRDPELFETLSRQVVEHIVTNTPSGGVVRCWTPGCSTGEEPYSLAMLFQEKMNIQKKSIKVQLFATDIDARAISFARNGVYTASIASDLTAERLELFFDHDLASCTYRIHKNIRDMIVFSEQDLIKDPPFSRLDLISCRNLLIYLGPELQKRIIPLFHYALNPGRYLFLGNSESVGDSLKLFATTDRKAKIYQRLDDSQREILSMITRTSSAALVGSPTGKEPKKHYTPKISLRELTERSLLEHLSLSGALVNVHGDVLYVHGKTGRYLEPASGEANQMNIHKMAREGLKLELITALHLATKNREPVHKLKLQVKTNGDYSLVNLTVQPVSSPTEDFSSSPLFVVIFADEPLSPENLIKPADSDDTGVDHRIAELKEQLRAKEEYLQSTNEELETSNEELKSSSEEMQSVNEELQSTNEELETSKEELQSVNEELATVNAELQQKVGCLSQTNNDMSNLLSGTGIGTVFVDLQMHILRFTPAVTPVIPLIMSDIGRPLGNIVTNLSGYPHLARDAKSVLDTLISKEIEVRSNDGLFFQLRLLPYRTIENTIEGVVITFVDISAMKQAQEIALDAKTTGQLLFNAIPMGVTLHDSEGCITDVNFAAEQIFGLSLERLKGTNPSLADWEQFAKDGSPLANEAHPLAIAMQTGRTVPETLIGFRPFKNSDIIWIRTRVTPFSRATDSKPYRLCSTFEKVDRPLETCHEH